MQKQLMILALLLLAAPTVIGGLFLKTDRLGKNILFRWVSGQFLLWAGFQLICVPLVLRGERFGHLVQLFLGYLAALTLLAAALEIQSFVKREKVPSSREAQKSDSGRAGSGELLWIAFWGILLFQLAQAVRLVYEDADDAYYVAVAGIAEQSDTMFQRLPYTGASTGLDARHGLAPFSIWIAFLARLSGMRTVAVAHTVLPVVLIAMSYSIYYLFSVQLFPKKKRQRPLFLLLVEVLVLFGNHSVYTAEVFLLGRLRQGKASLGSLVFPFLLLLALLLMRKIQEREKISVGYYLLTGAAATAGCLCSTLGSLLACLLIGAVGLFAAACYKRLGTMFALAACCVPCVAYAFLYLVLG